MARIARVIAAGMPHHVTQRGNRRMTTFFREQDYRDYIALMAQWCRTCSVEVWAYCLMPNHVHLIAVPGSESFLVGQVKKRSLRKSGGMSAREGHWEGEILLSDWNLCLTDV